MPTIIQNRQKFYVPIVKTRLTRRRNKYDILAEILATCKKRPRTQSWLLAHLRLSTSSGKNYIGFLVATKLIEANKPQGLRSTTYKTTAKGKKALRKYNILTTQYFSL